MVVTASASIIPEAADSFFTAPFLNGRDELRPGSEASSTYEGRVDEAIRAEAREGLEADGESLRFFDADSRVCEAAIASRFT